MYPRSSEGNAEGSRARRSLSPTDCDSMPQTLSRSRLSWSGKQNKVLPLPLQLPFDNPELSTSQPVYESTLDSPNKQEYFISAGLQGCHMAEETSAKAAASLEKSPGRDSQNHANQSEEQHAATSDLSHVLSDLQPGQHESQHAHGQVRGEHVHGHEQGPTSQSPGKPASLVLPASHGTAQQQQEQEQRQPSGVKLPGQPASPIYSSDPGTPPAAERTNVLDTNGPQSSLPALHPSMSPTHSTPKATPESSSSRKKSRFVSGSSPLLQASTPSSMEGSRAGPTTLTRTLGTTGIDEFKVSVKPGLSQPGVRDSKCSVISWAGGLDVQGSNNYIPFRYKDLSEELRERYHEFFGNDDDRIEQFHQLVRWMSWRNNLRLLVRFRNVFDDYHCVDPDADLEDLQDMKNLGEILSREAPSSGHAVKSKDSRFFQESFEQVLDKGDFDEMSLDELAEMNEAQGGYQGLFGTGLNIQRVNGMRYDVRIWYRGKAEREEPFSSWLTLFRTRVYKVHTFERVVCLFRQRSEDEERRLQEEAGMKAPGTLHKWWQKVYRFLIHKKRSASNAHELSPNKLYLKMFKHVAHYDINMLLPGCTVLFSWLDYLIIWGAIIVGLGFAIYKIATGNMRFNTLAVAFTSVILVIMPLFIAIKGYLRIRAKVDELQSYINTLYVMHNLANNCGVISLVLSEAGEQEDKECLLAYFFLWRGQDVPEPRKKEELDLEVEEVLTKIMRERGMGNQGVDFGVLDSVNKLNVMGILMKRRDPDGSDEETYQVVGLQDALEKCHISKFNEAKEVPAMQRERSHLRRRTMSQEGTAALNASIAGIWLECRGTCQKTHKPYRYFYNTNTAETKYEEPGDYIPISHQTSCRKSEPGHSDDPPSPTDISIGNGTELATEGGTERGLPPLNTAPSLDPPNSSELGYPSPMRRPPKKSPPVWSFINT